MRHFAGLASALAATLAATTVQAMGVAPLALPRAEPLRVEYYCSPGFEPGRGGTCVAVPSRAEIELFIDQPIYGGATRSRVRHRRRGLRARF